MKQLTLSLLCLIFLFSCKNKPVPNDNNTTDTEQEATLPLSFKTEKNSWSAGDCNTPDKPCLNIELSYPVAENGNDTVREKINDDIMGYLISSLEMEEPDESSPTLEAAAQRFIDSYKEMADEFPEGAMNWAVEMDGQHAIYKNVLVIKLLSYTNTGGAHPNTYQSFTNFNLDTGEEIYYEDVVVDSTGLKKLAEQKFYSVRKKMDEAFEKGDAFWGNSFSLPENFAITKNGVKFFYNNYEALPYVYGHTEFMIPYSQLDGLIKLPPESE